MKSQLAKILLFAAVVVIAPIYGTQVNPDNIKVGGVQVDSLSPLKLSIAEGAGLLGTDGIWQPIIGPVQGSTFTGISAVSGFGGATCQSEYRRGSINADKGSLTLDIFLVRCGTPGSSAFQSNGSFRVVGGAGSLSGVVSGTGIIAIDHHSDGSAIWFLEGALFQGGPGAAAAVHQMPDGAPVYPIDTSHIGRIVLQPFKRRVHRCEARRAGETLAGLDRCGRAVAYLGLVFDNDDTNFRHTVLAKV